MKKQYMKILERYYCGALLLIGAKHAHLMQRFDCHFQPSVMDIGVYFLRGVSVRITREIFM